MRKFKFVVYLITFPDGKIYIGKDVEKNGHAIRYFGSWNNEYVEADFTKKNFKISRFASRSFWNQTT